MRARTSLQGRNKRQLKISSFKGVDLSSSPARIDENRASYMVNFLPDGGALRKRKGFSQFKGKLSGRINGIYTYGSGENRALLVHYGTKICRYASMSDSVKTDLMVEGALIKDQRSTAFERNGRLYIVGAGDFLVYGTWDNGRTYQLRRVADCEDNYIPTTTININHTEETNDVRATLDAVNLLSPWRKNRLVGSDGMKTWRLDASIDTGTGVYLEIETLDEEGKVVEKSLKTFITGGEASWEDVPLYEWDPESEEPQGHVDYTHGTVELGNSGFIPPVEGRDNITVRFCHTTEGYKDRIGKCGFGALFGVDGNSDRLFLSGNVDNKNVVFYSEPEDFTYFPDVNALSFGSDSTAVCGFMRLDDQTMAVLKDQKEEDPVIWYMTGKWQTSYDSEGKLESITALFPVSAGSVGEICVTRFGNANLCGDPLMLTKKGVFGIRITDNLTTSNRYAVERSRMIREVLERTDLSDAAATVYEGKYLLSVQDEEETVYVADAAYTCYPSDTAEKQKQYEWFVQKGIPARIWAEIDGRLYFGTKTGYICFFDDSFEDKGAGIQQSVTAEWRSAYLDCGDSSVGKTLLQMTVNAEHTKDQMVFGFRTKRNEKWLKMKGLRVFSFNDLSFNDFSFQNDFPASYTMRVKERSFNFIIFRIRSEGAYDCRINSISATYKILEANRGVR